MDRAHPSEAEDLWPLVVELLLNAKGWWLTLCSELELTAAQGHALRALDPQRPVPMSALADALWCDASNVTGIVDKLESRGLIERQGADHDRRIKQLAVTERGRQLRDQLNARVLEPPQAISCLPSEVKTLLVRTIRALLAERSR
jgi:DNA-binding MarR family transcriptional regulator